MSIDTLSSQYDIAQKISESKADYLLAFKDNQKELLVTVSDFFMTAIEKNFTGVESLQIKNNDYGHGRIE